MITRTKTAPTQFVEAEGIRYAYRRFGTKRQVPMLFLSYLRSNMDGWDPIVTNGLAADNEIILFDNPGVGVSTGKCPTTVAGMAKNCAAFCRALSLWEVDLVGFSLGGMIAQQLANDDPQLVRRLILLGTGPRGGEGMTFTDLSPEEQDADPIAFLLACSSSALMSITARVPLPEEDNPLARVFVALGRSTLARRKSKLRHRMLLPVVRAMSYFPKLVTNHEHGKKAG